MNREDRQRRFVETVRERRDGMYRVALSMLHAAPDAEDAVSNAVEAAWRRLDRVRDMDALSAYLMRCTVNSCHTALRRVRRETAADDLSAMLPPFHDATPVWELLGGLPEKYRLPLILRYSEGMTIDAVARALRLTRSGASSRIARGLRILREQMGEEGMDRE